MWVPEWPWVAPWRHSRVDGRDDGVALDELAGLDVDAVRPQGLGDLLDVGDGGLGGAATPVPVMLPSSAIWPPDSA